MFENQFHMFLGWEAGTKWRESETIWPLRKFFFKVYYATYLVLPPPISGDHQYVSAEVGQVEAFHKGPCPLAQHPVELRLFLITLFYPFLSLAAMSSQLLDSGFAKDKYGD